MLRKVVVINSDVMGKGDEILGKRLIGSFLRKLWVFEIKPDAIVFYNSGVKLLTEGSGVIDALDALYAAGVDILACGTCVEYFHIAGCMPVGRVSNMEEIAGMLMSAESVVTI